MVVRILSSLYFTQLGVRELYLGYINYLGLPWNLKFLWAPLVDGWGTKRGWQVGTQACWARSPFSLRIFRTVLGYRATRSSTLAG